MGTEIVVPQSQALQELNEKLAVLVEQAKSIEIKDAVTRIAAAGVRTGFKAYIEAVKLQTGGQIALTKEMLDRLKQDQTVLLAPAQSWCKLLEDKDAAYREEERRQAKVEEDRKNAELRAEAERRSAEERKERERQAEIDRKAREKEVEAQRKAGEIGKREADRLKKEASIAAQAEVAKAEFDAAQAVENAPTVTVKPNITAVAGAPRAQVYYSAEITDSQAIIRAYETAKDPVRIAFLRRFIQVNEQEVGKFARDLKDSKKAAELLPGVKFTSKG